MKKLLLITFFLLVSLSAGWAQDTQQPSPQALMQAAFRQAQRCLEQAVVDEARLRTEMQTQIDALRKQIDLIQKEKKEEKKD